MDKWKNNFPTLAIIFLSIISFTMLIMTNFAWEKSTKEYILLEQEMTTLRNDITEGHLWLEESTGGDKLIDVNKDILTPFAHQRFKKFSKKYKKNIPNLKAITSKLILLEEMVKKRLYNIVKRKTGSATDQKFDVLFKENLTLIDSAIAQINQKMHDTLDNRHKSFIQIITIFFLLNIGMFIFIYFIQKNKKIIEKVLDKEREQLTLAINATQAGLWDWDLITNEVYYAPQWKAILGYKGNELSNTYETWSNLVHPDDLVQAEQKILAAKLQHTEMYEITFRMKHKDGHWVWILSKGQTIYDNNDQPIRMIGFHTDVSEQQRALLELHKSEAKFYSLFHNSPDMHLSVSAKDATVNFCNDTLLKTLGYKRDEVIGYSVFNLYHEDNLQIVKEAFSTFKTTGVVKNVQLKVKRKNGTPISITLNANAVRNEEGNILYSIATWRDITEIKKTEIALESSVAQIHSIFRSAPIGIGFLSNRIFKEVNEKFCQMTGYSKEELVNQSSRILYQDDISYQVAGEEGTRLATKYGTGTIETQFLCKNGNIIDILLSGTPLDPNNHSLGITVTALDITDEKKKDKLMIVQSRHAAMGEMIGMIAHQWRQPISVISMDINNMLVDIELDDFNTEKAKIYANNILIHTQHLSKTIDDFRNFFKPDKAVTKIKVENVLEETYAMIKDSFKNKKIIFKKSYTTVPKVDAYHRELMQVFVNILNNAKDVLTTKNIDNARIEIKIYEDEQYVNAEICDNAGGIDKEILPKIFDPYFTTKDEKTGTGLGLYMSKMIIEDHLRGVLEVCNQDNGACFRVRLPKENNEIV